ncbi:hypothetical protein BJ742DRAFT_801624 [Cladochytrium replicatum]|nr:hypothetical protein BJ742DRAFT_801624 [Cladochytrium replicatum]
MPIERVANFDLPSSMKAVVLKKPTVETPKGLSRYDPISVESVPLPEVAPGHVVVRLYAAALNHRDVFMRQGLYPGIQFNSVCGADGAGLVVAVNPKSPKHSALLGTAVIIPPSVGWDSDPRTPEDITEFRLLGQLPLPGTFAQYIVFNADLVLPIRPSPNASVPLRWSDYAAIPLAGLTAWRAVVTVGRVDKGMKILIPGIGGGVALFAMQFAIAKGAEVVVTSSSPEKIQRAIKLGAKGGVLYTKPTWVKEAQALVPEGYDAVIDGASGSNWTLYQKLLKSGGVLSVYGATAGSTSEVIAPFLWFKHLEIRGVCMGSHREFLEMANFVMDHGIRPVIDTVYNNGFDTIEDAYVKMRDGKQFGKLVVAFGTDEPVGAGSKL